MKRKIVMLYIFIFVFKGNTKLEDVNIMFDKYRDTLVARYGISKKSEINEKLINTIIKDVIVFSSFVFVIIASLIYSLLYFNN